MAAELRITPTGSETLTVNAADLHPHPASPRRGDLRAIAESIAINGWYSVLLVQRRTGHIVIGGQAFLAGRSLGMDVFPVSYIDVTDDEAIALMLIDNRTSDQAATNDMGLAELLKQIRTETGSYGGTGYDARDADKLVAGLDAADASTSPLQNLQLKCGPYTHTVTKARYFEWQTELRQRAGFRAADQIKELRCRLKLPPRSN